MSKKGKKKTKWDIIFDEDCWVDFPDFSNDCEKESDEKYKIEIEIPGFDEYIMSKKGDCTEVDNGWSWDEEKMNPIEEETDLWDIEVPMKLDDEESATEDEAWLYQDFFAKKPREVEHIVASEAKMASELDTFESTKGVLITQNAEKDKPAKGRKSLSVFEVAERVIKHSNVISYNGIVYHFGGICYEPVDQKRVVTLVKKTLSTKELHSLSSPKFMDDVFNCLKRDESIVIELGSKGDGSYVTFLNGTVDIMTGELHDHSPYFHTFYCIKANYLDDEYDLETPAWDNFLNTSIHNELAEKLFMATLGYLVSPFVSAKKFFVLGTAPNSGKSLVASFLEGVIEQQLISHAEIESMSGNFGLESLIGKIINLEMDMVDGSISQKAVSRLKKITGLDVVEINAKYEHPQDYFVTTKFVFGTNFPLKFKGQDDALLERMVFIPFMHSTPKAEQDKDLLDKLLAEKDEILTKAIAEARKLYFNGFCFPGEDKFKAMGVGQTEDIFLEEFLNTCCFIEDEPVTFTSTVQLYRVYVELCRTYRVNPLSEKDFSHKLPSMKDEGKIIRDRKDFRSNGNRNQQRGFRGIVLLDNED